MKIVYQFEKDDLAFLKDKHSELDCGDCPYSPPSGFNCMAATEFCGQKKAYRTWYKELEKRNLQKVYEDYQEVVKAEDAVKSAQAKAEEVKLQFCKKYNIAEKEL